MDYDPKQMEQKWQDYWDKNQTFKVDRAGEKNLYVLDMFTYPWLMITVAPLLIGKPPY